MLLPTTLLLSICSTLLFSSSALAQTNQTYGIDCLRFPPTISGNFTFNPDAISALSQAISDNSLNPPLPSQGVVLKPGRSSRIGWTGSGGFQVCLQSYWFFKTITIPLSDLSGAIAAMGTTCCNDGTSAPVPGAQGRQGRCQDARAMVPGTDGSLVRLVTQDYGDNCCGLWGC